MKLETALFLDAFERIAAIGATPQGGCERLSMSDADLEARALLIDLLQEEQFAVEQDPTGAIWARLEGEEPSLPPVLVGSHLDTVRNAGKYDGLLGVMLGYWALRQIRREHLPHRRAIELLVFPNEESARFNFPTAGSKLLAGKIEPEQLRGCLDDSGLSLYDALLSRGFSPDHVAPGRRRLREAFCFLELHIEQGPSLDDRGIPIGIVEAIAAPTRLEIEIKGQYAHSGACPMHLRHDALAAAAELILAVEKIGRYEAVNHSVAAVTRCHLVNESMNVVPGHVVLGLDIRGIDRNSIECCVQEVRRNLRQICSSREVSSTVTITSRDVPVLMSPTIIHAIRKSCERCRLPYVLMPSGAGHDAMNVAAVTETGMIFIPCKDGVSHNPAESVAPSDIEAGYAVLLDLLLDRAKHR